VIIAMAAGFGVAMLASTMTRQPATTIADITTTITPTDISDGANNSVQSEPSQPATSAPAKSPQTSIAGIAPTPEASRIEASVEPSVSVEGTEQQPVAVSDPDVPQAAFAEDTFSSSASGWPVRETETWSAQYVDDRYQLTLKGKPTIGFSFPLPSEQYRLGVDVTVRGGSAGVVFLYAEPSTFYQLVIDEENRYAIQRVDGEIVTNVVDWTPSEALSVEPNAADRLRVRREGTLVHFFANDELLTDFAVPPGEVVNRYGFVVNSSNGEAQATFDNLIGERLLAP
jgi:hypothetical protein